MKKLVLTLLVAAFGLVPAIAQDQKTQDHKQSRAEWEQKVKDELKLNTEQVAKFDALNKEYNDKIDVIAQDATLSKDVQKEKKMALKKEKETKLFEFLTPEQQTKYKELVEKKKKEMEAKPQSNN